MYSTKSLFPYAEGKYMIIPNGLPERFYPKNKNDRHVVGDDVICFIGNVSDEIKKRLINDYKEHCKKQKESDLYY